jgi:hypothetical protein
MWDYPFGVAASHVQGATADEAVEKAKTLIDAGGKREHESFTARHDESEA